MRLFVSVLIMLMFVGFVFAESTDFRDRDAISSTDQYKEKATESRPNQTFTITINEFGERVKTAGGDSDDQDNARDVMASNRTNARKSLDRSVLDKLKSNVRSRCEATNNSELKRKCTELINDSRNCQNEDNSLSCRRSLVAVAARRMAMERHDLNEQCRNLTSGNRSECEREVNALFRNEIHARFKAFLSEHLNKTEDFNSSELNEIKEKHKERVKMIRSDLNSTVKEGLLDRLEHVLDERDAKSERMQAFIDKAMEKGHDTSELEFLLGEYNTAIVNAKTYSENKQYRDALSSIKDANRLFAEFKRLANSIVREHKEDKRHSVDPEKAFSEDSEDVPSVPESES